MEQLLIKLLENPIIQTAIITAVVIGSKAFVGWIQTRWPTQAALVEANWCYLQPIVDAAMAESNWLATSTKAPATAFGNVVTKGVAEFAASYRKLEGKEATDKELVAARNEITSAVARVTGA